MGRQSSVLILALGMTQIIGPLLVTVIVFYPPTARRLLTPSVCSPVVLDSLQTTSFPGYFPAFLASSKVISFLGEVSFSTALTMEL
jgi:hypothetical protein